MCTLHNGDFTTRASYGADLTQLGKIYDNSNSIIPVEATRTHEGRYGDPLCRALRRKYSRRWLSVITKISV